MSRTLRAATAHISPVLLSSHETTQKVIKYIHRAASQDANLICFPESFIPAFPVWSSFQAPTRNHHLFHRIAKESILADGEEVRAIQHAAVKSKLTVSVGFSEKVKYSAATLFNSNLVIGSDGQVLVHHRKLMPTWFERLTWSQGDGHGLKVANTKHGKVGVLICGENTNPLARFTMMAQGEEVHISSWPAIWPSRTIASSSGGNAKDKPEISEGKNYDNVAANRTRAAAHCFEAKCFGIMCAPYFSKENIDAIVALCDDEEFARGVLNNAPRAASMFLDPTGTVLPGFTVDEKTGQGQEKEMLQHDEDVLYTDMHLDQCVEGKQYHDVVGGYQRFDVFNLKVNMERRDPVSFERVPSGP